jgi:DNA gyrase subunit A
MHRGGQGVTAMSLSANSRSGATRIIASFPVDEGDQVMLVTDGGQSIRCGVSDISVRSRGAGGVWMLRTGEEERVVSVARLAEQSGEDEDDSPDSSDSPPEGDAPDET